MEFTSTLKRQRSRYKLAAIPVYFALVFLLHSPDGLTWLEAAAVGFGLLAVAELIVLPAWYSCRIAPIQKTPAWRLMATHLIAAFLLSWVWLAAGKLIAHALSFVPALHDIDAHFASRGPIVYGAGYVFYLLSM